MLNIAILTGGTVIIDDLFGIEKMQPLKPLNKQLNVSW